MIDDFTMSKMDYNYYRLSRRYLARGIMVAISLTYGSALVSAQTTEQGDSIVNKLEEVVIQGKSEIITENGVRYTPDRKQKATAMTGADLIGRMGIPQLVSDRSSGTITAADGGDIAIFINKVPASTEEIRAMRPKDVIYVEVIDHPTDPMFQGKQRVLNFVMRKYEYGGYLKLHPTETFITDEGSVQANLRVNYKAMTYDLMALGAYDTSNHTYSTLTESFKFPNGYPSEDFISNSGVSAARKKDRSGALSFRALYSSNYISANSTISAKIDRQPLYSYAGSVAYQPTMLPLSEYSSESSYTKRFISYSGDYFFSLPKRNSLNISLQSVLSSTSQNSSYSESDLPLIYNGGRDISSDLRAVLFGSHAFSQRSNLRVMLSTIYSHQNTTYTGSVSADDRSYILYFLGGISYSLQVGKWNTYIGGGATRTLSRLNAIHTVSYGPYADLSVAFRLNSRQKFSLEGHMSVWTPPADQKSEVMIHTRPFLWITGNPALRQYSSLDLGLNYLFLISPKLSLSSYVSFWELYRGLAYDYIPNETETGILRTIIQPRGKYLNQKAGASLTLRLFDRSLMLRGDITENHVHDRGPAGWTGTFVSYSLQGYYYLGNFYYGAEFKSARKVGDQPISSVRQRVRSTWNFYCGWSSGDLNVCLTAYNLSRWDWKTGTIQISSPAYSSHQELYGDSRHASIELTASYTLGFGKKVKKGNDLNDRDYHSSGLLQ